MPTAPSTTTSSKSLTRPRPKATPSSTPAGRDYYGPINLSFAATTDVKAKPIINQKDETQLTVQKTDTAGKALAGATFTVRDKEGQYAAIDADARSPGLIRKPN